MTYREAYMKCNTLSELETMVKKDIVAVKLLGSSDRIKVIKDTAEEVANLKFKENEAVEILKNITEHTKVYEDDVVFTSDFAKAYEMAIKALEKQSMVNEILHELKEYSLIGTIEEFKVLKAKVAPKKPIPLDKWGEYHECPVCGKHAENSYGCKYLYCPNCGCKYDWSE